MRKPTFCICESKDADQLRSNRRASQRLCFRYKDGTIPLLSKSEISRLYPYSFAAQLGLCLTWSATRTLDFARRGSYNLLYSVKKGKQEPRDHHQTQHSPNSLALFATDSLELKLAHIFDFPRKRRSLYFTLSFTHLLRLKHQWFSVLNTCRI